MSLYLAILGVSTKKLRVIVGKIYFFLFLRFIKTTDFILYAILYIQGKHHLNFIGT